MHHYTTASASRGAQGTARPPGHRRPRAVALLALLLLAGAAHAASFPFNGSFELVAAGKPMGWQVVGAWFVRPDAATDGRNGITVFGDFGREGARLSTTGFLLSGHEPVTLSFTYTSPTGGVSCGVEFCDALGNPLGNGAWEEIPASATSGRYERLLALPETVTIPARPTAPAAPATTEPPPTAEPPATTPPAAEQPAPAAQPAAEQPAAAAPTVTVDITANPPAEAPAAPAPPPATTVDVPYAAIRLVFRLDRDGAQIKLDNVKVAHTYKPVALPLPPKIKAETRPNLLANGGFALSGECDPRGWTAVNDANHDVALATALPQVNFLNLQSARGLGAAWLSDPVLLDGALPYSLQTNVNAQDVQECRFRTVIIVVDPQDERSVWLLEEREIAPEQTGAVRLVLPRLWTAPGAVRARVGFEIQACGDGQAQVRNAALCPEPLSLSVRAAASAGGFKRPSDVALFIAAVNNTYVALKPKAVLQVTTSAGKLVVSENRPIVIGLRSAAYFPYKPKLTANGAYRLSVKIMNGTVELGSTQYEFRVGPPPTDAP